MASETTPLLHWTDDHRDARRNRKAPSGKSLQGLTLWMKIILILLVSSTILEIGVRVGYMAVNSQFYVSQAISVLDVILIMQSLLSMTAGILFYTQGPNEDSVHQDDISERGEMRMSGVQVSQVRISNYNFKLWTKMLMFSAGCVSVLQILILHGWTESGSSTFVLVLCFVALQGLCFFLAGLIIHAGEISNSLDMSSSSASSRKTSNQISCYAWVCFLFDLGCTFSYVSCGIRLIHWFEKVNQSIDYTALLLCSTLIIFVYSSILF